VGGTVTAVSGGTDIISYSVPSSCGPGVATYTMTVIPDPVSGTITGPSAVCVSSTIALLDAAPGGTWTATNATATIAGSTGVVTGVTQGVDTMFYTVTNVCGTAQSSSIVTVNPLPVSGTITGPSSVCVGATIVLIDAAPGGLWSSSNASATVSGGSVMGVVQGRDTISYAVTNICGTATARATVTVNDVPPISPITGPSDLCATAHITLSSATPGGVWSSSGSAATVSGGIVTGVSLGVVTISYTITNMCGAVTVTYPVSVDAVPSAGSISGPSSVCPYELITLTDAIPGGTWTIDNANALLDAAGHLAGMVPGTSIVTYTVSNHCGTNFITYTVTIKSFDSCDRTGVNPLSANDVNLNVFPNPSHGNFTLFLSSDVTEDAIVVVTNIVGEKVRTVITTTNKETNVSVNAPAGIYFVNVYTGRGRYQAKMIIE
jgi:hypothetical protein